MSNTAVMDGYTKQITDLPPEAFLGSLLFFSISQADVHLANARRDLEAMGLSTATLRKNLRPIDSFRKAGAEFKKKFPVEGGVRSEFMVRPVGDDPQCVYIQVILERCVVESGKKRRVFYDKVAELTLTRGQKVKGLYVNHGVEARRTTSFLEEMLTEQEDQWLTEHLVTFEDRYNHLLTFMDSHAVRTFVREYIYSLKGTCVKESGGLYFVKQDEVETTDKLSDWVSSIGSEFHTLPLLNLAKQRTMIMEAFEDETIKEVDRLVAEVQKILANPDTKITDTTFDQYGLKAAELKAKVLEYNDMLGARADRATFEIDGYTQQVLALLPRVKKDPKIHA